MNQKKKNKKLYIIALIAVPLLFFVFNINISSTSFNDKAFTEDGFAALKNLSIAPSAHGQGAEMPGGQNNVEADAGWLGNMVLQAINWLLYFIFLFFAWMLGLSGYLFDWAVDADNIRNIIHREAIYSAWKMVRDFLNLGFILILLYSAFCTVFQIEKYHLKKILLMLVLMALLVNFSFPISRFIVDASNVTMYFFLQSAFGDASTSFSAGLTKFTGIADILVPRKDGNFDSYGSTTQILMAIFFVICLLITMFVIAAILIIRVMALAVLIIFSSIGFVAAVLPDTKTFANKWWSTLFKYAFAGPILVFMLLIAYKLMAEMAIEGTKEAMEQAAQNYTGEGPFDLANAAYFFLPIVLLWMGIFSTRTMSIFGANWITSKATGAAGFLPKKLLKGSRYMAIAGLKKTERELSTGTPIKEGSLLSKLPGLKKLAGKEYNLSPRAAVQGWKERAKRVDEDFLGTATGSWHDNLNSIFSRGKEKTSYKYQAQQALAAKEQKRLSEINEHSDFLMSEFDNIKDSKDPKKAEKMQAIFKTLFKNNDGNEMMKWFEKDVTPKNIKKTVAKHLKGAGLNEEQIALHLMELGEVAFAHGNYGLYGMGRFNNDKDAKKFEISDDIQQEGAAAAKIANIEPQQKLRQWHWNSILTEDWKTHKAKARSGPHDIGKKLLKTITQSDIGQVQRARIDFLNNLSSAESEIRDFADKEGGDQGRLINEFMNKVIEQKGGEHKEKIKKEATLDEHAKMI